MITHLIQFHLSSQKHARELQLLGVLLFISIILIFVGLGFRDPWPADEPRFAQIAKEMVETGQWFFPARAAEFYPDKPPVFMWSIAIFYALFGSLNIAFLLPSALCSLLTIYLVFDIGRKLWNPETGFIAGLLLVFSFQFMLQAKSAQIDAMVCAWITLGCYGFLRFLLFDAKWRWFYLACFFMGIGVITKGVGFLPILILIPYMFMRFICNYHSILKPDNESIVKWVLGLLVMLLAIGLWFVPMLVLVELSHNPLLEQYRDNILFKQTVTRYADSWHHIKPFWYYFVSVIPAFWLPLSIFIPWLIPHWIRAIKKQDARVILPLTWIVLVLVFFSISPGKRGVYILPALPMLALISAPYVRQILQRRAVNWILWALVTGISLGLLAFALAGLSNASFTQKLVTEYAISPWYFFISIGLAGLLGTLITVKQQQWRSWPLFISVAWILYSTWGYGLLEVVKTPKKIFQQMQHIVPQNAEVGLVDFAEQFILFSPYPITHFGYHTDNAEQVKAAYQWIGTSKNRFILLSFELVEGLCFDKNKAIHLGFAHRTDWVLLNTASRVNGCPKPQLHKPQGNIIEYQYIPKP
ncbi:glycosyltransferase family 39 protein [Aliiglaciecola lipolytica]|nr:glycosyltransferase family 39 protein [Aliiglaciecola lipolytica]